MLSISAPLAEASKNPSGVTASHSPFASASSVASAPPVCASQTLTVPSRLPEKRRRPSGENATAAVPPGCPAKA